MHACERRRSIWALRVGDDGIGSSPGRDQLQEVGTDAVRIHRLLTLRWSSDETASTMRSGPAPGPRAAGKARSAAPEEFVH